MSESYVLRVCSVARERGAETPLCEIPFILHPDPKPRPVTLTFLRTIFTTFISAGVLTL